MEPTPPKRNTRQVMLAVNVETTKDVEAPEIDPALASPTGDLVLVVHRHSLPSDRSTVAVTGHHPEPETAFQYRVDSKRLQETSAYFARLLDPDKFGEGAAVAEHHVTLRSKYPTLDLVPFEELPTVHIADVGKISPTVKSIQNLMGDFLRALHDQDLSVKVPPLANVANLVVVADRFDALVAVRQYFKSRKLMALLDAKGSIAAKGQEKAINTWSEERVRQRLLVGLLLDNATWVWYSSSRLIHRGWVGKEADDNAALWWDLPMGIEEELLFRRDSILETVQSLQTHFLDLYTSKDRQCKLGYDSSSECDVFQLGQMIKFFKRTHTLSLSGTLIPTSDPSDPYDGDIFDLLDQLRQVPEYQIDKNHHHCGLRTRILPLLDLVAYSLNNEVGVCLHCWLGERGEYAWSRAKRPLIWKHGSAGAAMVRQYRVRQAQSHLFKHFDAMHLFMADERMWTG